VGTIVAEGLRTAGTAQWDGQRLRLPLAITATRLVTGNRQIDPRLPGARIDGDVLIGARQITSERIDVALKGLAAKLVLRGDLARSSFALSGPVTAKGLLLPDLGMADADASVALRFGGGRPWSFEANGAGRMTRIDNATLASLTGGNVRLRAALSYGERLPLLLRSADLTSVKLAMALRGTLAADGAASMTGKGQHLDYGPFTFDAAMAKDGPRATLVLANPLPAASLKDVHVALSPLGDGFRIETKGDSRLGPFSGLLGLTAPKDGPLRLVIERFTVYQTELIGSLALAKEGVTGSLVIAGGGVTGSLDLAPRGSGQGLKATLTARGARFGGDRPIAVGNATITADGLLEAGNSTLEASVSAEGHPRRQAVHRPPRRRCRAGQRLGQCHRFAHRTARHQLCPAGHRGILARQDRCVRGGQLCWPLDHHAAPRGAGPGRKRLAPPAHASRFRARHADCQWSPAGRDD